MEEKQITLQIDGHFITVPEGSTILEAASKIGINIPTLCHIDLKGTCIKNNPASCRICVVEVARTAQSGSRLRYPLHGRDGGENQYPTRDERPESGSRTDPVRSSQRLSHLSQMRQLRTPDTGTAFQHP